MELLSGHKVYRHLAYLLVKRFTAPSAGGTGGVVHRRCRLPVIDPPPVDQEDLRRAILGLPPPGSTWPIDDTA